jgi:hypothetical protein
MSRNTYEDRVAKRLESEGLLVLRTYKRGLPDIIAFPASIAGQITMIEVKGPKDHPSPHQQGVIERLKTAGVNASFEYVHGPREKNLTYRSHADVLAFEKAAFDEGYKAQKEGKKIKDWPSKRYKNGTNSWYRLRVSWREGWNKALDI